MAIHIDGFEQFGGTDRPETFMRLAGYTIVGTVALAGGHKGNSQSVACYRSSLSRDWQFGPVLSVGFAYKFDERGGVFEFAVGDTKLSCFCDPTTGLINLGNDVGYITPLKGRWYYFEVTLDKSANTAMVAVNGKIDVSTVLPPGFAAAAMINIRLNPYQTVNGDFGTRQFDDFYISDSTSIGPIQVTTRLPSGDRDTEWGLAGASSHNGAVGRLPPEMLDRFIFSSTNDDHDSFISGAPLPDKGAVLNVGLITLLRKATADPLSVEVNIDSNTAMISNIGREWSYRYTMMGPSGYDADSILGAEFGVRLKL